MNYKNSQLIIDKTNNIMAEKKAIQQTMYKSDQNHIIDSEHTYQSQNVSNLIDENNNLTTYNYLIFCSVPQVSRKEYKKFLLYKFLIKKLKKGFQHVFSIKRHVNSKNWTIIDISINNFEILTINNQQLDCLLQFYQQYGNISCVFIKSNDNNNKSQLTLWLNCVVISCISAGIRYNIFNTPWHLYNKLITKYKNIAIF